MAKSTRTGRWSSHIELIVAPGSEWSLIWDRSRKPNDSASNRRPRATRNRQYRQLQLFAHDDRPQPEWVEVDAANVRVENQLDFGGPWLALELIRKLKLDEFLESVMPSGKEDVPWSRMAIVLAISRLCSPSSELNIAEHYYAKTAMPELLGIPSNKVYDERLYRTMHDRFEQRIDEALKKVEISCRKRKWKKETIDRRVGKIMARNSRAAGLFEVEVNEIDGRAVISWTKNEKWRDWATLNEGCYLLRTNVANWSAEDLWEAYIQLTEAEAAFRISESTRVICVSARSGTNGKIVSCRTFWSVFWLMCYGRRCIR